MRIISTLAATLVLTACGGGGGSNNNTPAPGGNTGGGTGSGSGSGSGWVTGQYDSISSLENLCENPRTEGGYGDRSGSITDEKI